MRKYLKKEGGFTLIELLIVVVIIGILAAVAVPMYSRYMTSAKAAEAPTQIQALVEYAHSYMRAHPTDWSQSTATKTMMLYLNANESGTAVNDPLWMKDLSGTTPVYFTYYFNGAEAGLPATATNGAAAQGTDTPVIEAVGGRSTAADGVTTINNPFTTSDWLRAQLNDDGTVTWTASTGKMAEVRPSN